MIQNNRFGELIQNKRRKKGWTVKEFIEELGEIGKKGKRISPAYITKIEVHGEIPNPEVICKMANVLNYDVDELLKCAKQHKMDKFSNTLKKKYDKAFELYRSQKKRKNG